MRFDSALWENKGQAKQLRGYRIIVRQYNQGKDANFYFEAWGDPYARLRGQKPAPSIGKTVPGKGTDARNTAIQWAFDLAGTGLYTINPT